MPFQIKESPHEIEREFNRICEKISQYILKEDSETPPEILFEQLDGEFANVKKKYEQQNDEINLLHSTSNYLWRKSFQYLHKDPTQSLKLIIKALSKLLDRHVLRSYNADAFEKILGTYEVALIKIGEKWEYVDFDRIEKESRELFATSFSSPITSEKLVNVINILANLFIEKSYDKKINDLEVKYFNINKSEELVTNIKSILNVLVRIYSITGSYLPSTCYELLYRLRKKQLHSLASFTFFEKSDEKRQKAQNRVDQITKEMIDYSKKSFGYGKSYQKSLPPEKQEVERVKLLITLKELDKKAALYYREAYFNKDIFKAWTEMDKIKQFLVTKAFKENISLSRNLLRYFGEEWSLLYVFAKICLLKEEINKRTSSLGQDWERDIFTEIAKSLGAMEKLFKYEIRDTRDYTLKIMTSSFAGSFSEYFIHELCQEFFGCGIVDKRTPTDFRGLLECVKRARSKEDIKLNDIIEQGKPDIDIHIKNNCAIFFKNAKIESGEMKKIWGEIELCKKKGIKRIFYGINFIKNMEKIEDLRKSFKRIKETNIGINFDVFDIKDLVTTFLDELKRSGKPELHFSQLNLYRVLDY
jgi:hypothetical protein